MRKLDFFKEHYSVDPTSETGLRWAKDRGFKMKAGQIAGSFNNSSGYWQCSDGNYGKVLAHQVVYYLTHGVFTKAGMQIDHIDGNKLNNSVENLRLVTPTSNQRNANRKRNKNNTTGYDGVSPWNRYADGTIRYRAQYAGKFLGQGPDPKELSILVEKAKEKDPLFI